jgi:hypothetical protein
MIQVSGIPMAQANALDSDVTETAKRRRNYLTNILNHYD